MVHAGPFANIAVGNSSIVADQISLKLVGPVSTFNFLVFCQLLFYFFVYFKFYDVNIDSLELHTMLQFSGGLLRN